MDELSRTIREAWEANGEVPFPLYDREADLIANAVRTYLESPEVVERVAEAIAREAGLECSDLMVGSTFFARAALQAAGGKQDGC